MFCPALLILCEQLILPFTEGCLEFVGFDAVPDLYMFLFFASETNIFILLTELHSFSTISA